MKDLTKKQKEMLDKIKLYIDNYKRPPSIRDLCFLCGVNSTATVYVHLQKIKEKGYIDYIKGEHRSISIIEGGNDVQDKNSN